MTKSHLKYHTWACNICGTTNMISNVLGIHKTKSHLKYQTWACNICGTTNMINNVLGIHTMNANLHCRGRNVSRELCGWCTASLLRSQSAGSSGKMRHGTAKTMIYISPHYEKLLDHHVCQQGQTPNAFPLRDCGI